MKKLIMLSVLLLGFILSSSSFADTVTQEWAVKYNGLGGQDYATAMAVDSSGNVYVTGRSYGGGSRRTSYDYATVKYNSAGEEQWKQRYDGPGNDDYDTANAIAVDTLGNVYVTGSGTYSGTSADYVTVKYDSAGNEEWVRGYDGSADGPTDGADHATAIAVDSSGNVYVTGYSASHRARYWIFDYATVKYNSDGDLQWWRRYDGPEPGNGDYDIANAIAVDSSGNVYVTGHSRSSISSSSTSGDYATVKYGSDGKPLWVRRYDGPGNGSDHARAIAVDSLGNVYVTGESNGYATVKYDTDGEPLWVQRYIGSGWAMAVGPSGNVYVTGESNGYATVKYDSDGFPQWDQGYKGTGTASSSARAIAVDSSGNVYVTGENWNVRRSRYYDTVKYDSAGNEKWVQRYNSPVNEGEGPSIAVDTSDNVYVTGGSGGDYITVKYSQGPQENCTNRIDDDEDGLVDCADPDCAGICAKDCTTFEDKFDGTVIDPAKWNTTIDITGKRWCSSTTELSHNNPGNWQNVEINSCNGLTQASPYGDIIVGGGQASFSTLPNRRTFPYIWTGPPSKPSPFPSSGDFTIEVRMKFDSSTGFGTGFKALSWGNSNPVGDNPPNGQGTVFVVWSAPDGLGGVVSRIVGSPLVPVSDPLSFHNYKVEYINGMYSLYIDGVLRSGPTASNLKPNTMWVGNPVFTHWAPGDWSDFTIDSIKICTVVEDCTNGIDDDGDGLVDCADPDCNKDADGDGFVVPPCGIDCDDNDPNNIPTSYYADGDGDTYGNPLDIMQGCALPADRVTNNQDCDDNNVAINPNATEICNDNVDNDCDGLVDCDDPDCATNPACITTTITTTTSTTTTLVVPTTTVTTTSTTTTTIVAGCQCLPGIPGGCISGQVKDSGGNPVSRKTVKLKRIKPKTPRIKKKTKTDANGCYSFTGLEDGKYKVSLKKRQCGPKKRVKRVIRGGAKVNGVDLLCE